MTAIRPVIVTERDVVKVPLGGKYGEGKFAIVDACDLDIVRGYNWCLTKSGDGTWGRSPFYVARNYRKGEERQVGHGPHTVLVRLHLLIAPPIDGLVVDHMDGDTLNCRRRNLRYLTDAENTHAGLVERAARERVAA